MKIILDDTLIKEQLYPFTQTRHATAIRIGILTIREKWEKILGYPVSITPKEYFSALSTPDEAAMPAIMSGNIIPTKRWVEALLKAGSGGNIFADDSMVKIIKHPWEIFQYNDWALREDFELITAGRQSQEISSTNTIINAPQIFIEKGAVVEHSILNASAGPIYIGANAEIMEGCMIRGPFALCEGAVLKMGTKIYSATTIGPYCVAAGEIKNSILFGYGNKAHDGYLGDSVIGEWCNLGAGTTNSNVKNTAAEVNVWDHASKKYMPVGMKCGLLMGDYSRAAINTSFNTGTIVGVCCNIFGEIFPPKYIPDFTWGKEKYKFDKALQDIANWKKLKGKTVTEDEQNNLQEIYNQNK